MNAFNRMFVGLLCLAWVAALGAAIWLIWDQARVVDVSSSSLVLNFDIIAGTRAEQILGTIIAVVLMLPALMMLGFEMKPSPQRETSAADADRMQDRINSLEKELAEERGRNEALRDRDRDRVTDTDHRPAGHRRWNLLPRR